MASNCKDCGCNKIDCGCKDSFLTSPAPCPTPDNCPQAQPCSEVFDAQCIVYTGDPIICNQDTVVATNDSVADALNQVVDYVCNSSSSCCPTFVADIQFTGPVTLEVTLVNGTAPFTYEWTYAQPSAGSTTDFRGYIFNGPTNAQSVSLLANDKYYNGEDAQTIPSIGKKVLLSHFKVRVTDANGQIADAYYLHTRAIGSGPA